MEPSKLERGELLAMVGGLVLGLSLFLTWYHADSVNTVIAGNNGVGDYSGFDVHVIQRWLFLAAAAAPFILGYIIVRNHELSWPRGQVTAIVAIAVLGLLFYGGIIDVPGEPRSTVSLQIGWYVAVLGGILMLVGSFIRQAESEAVRKPPGVL